ncbi:MAG: diadenylate cyclase [Pirellulales bacterium]
MANTAWSLLRELQSQFRLADLFDILLVALFLYLVITWFRTSASRRMAVGVLVVGVVYVLARVFDMYLTTQLLRTGLTVGLVALVVIFQEDLRRAFEWIASWGRFPQPPAADAASRFSEVLADGLTLLASLKRGGLVVVEGHGAVDRHISAGTPLDGQISVPLLCSIFDPHSPGHDGAIVVEDNRIRQFAVHLPLSTSSHELKGLGTRHAAALGLSERCDALVLVVSEERGEISAAEGGRLSQLNSPAELRERLTGFHESRFPRRGGQSWNRRLWRDGGTKALAVTLAALAWLSLAFRTETVQRTFLVPIEYRNLQADWQLGETRPRDIRATLSGSERAFNLMEPGELRASVDLAGVRQGEQQIALTAANLNNPSDLEVLQLEPRSLSLEAFPVTRIRLAVEPRTRGQLPVHLELDGISVVPSQVRVTVSRVDRCKLQQIQTMPVDLAEITRTTTVSTLLDLPEGVGYVSADVSEVDVTVRVREKQSAQR